MKVQLLTFPECSNAAAARAALERALSLAGIRATIEEVDTTAPETPAALKGWGSPTILIDGVDVEGLEAPVTAGCRLYQNSLSRLQGVPPEETLRAALARVT